MGIAFKERNKDHSSSVLLSLSVPVQLSKALGLLPGKQVTQWLPNGLGRQIPTRPWVCSIGVAGGLGLGPQHPVEGEGMFQVARLPEARLGRCQQWPICRGQGRQQGGSCMARQGQSLALLLSNGDSSSRMVGKVRTG